MDINPEDISQAVSIALREDIGSGDISAELIPPATQAFANIISREAAIICGRPWVDEVFRQLDPGVDINWQVQDGDHVQANTLLFTLEGAARSLLSGERSALNFLQLLSGTATRCREYADLVASTGVQLLDTRKTLPGLRTAQKYAVRCGGCHNHRVGLFDAFLIKENHIAACGSIAAAIRTARKLHPERKLEIEVENLQQLESALAEQPDVIMCDNFGIEELRHAVALSKGQCKLEASGGISRDNLLQIAETGVDYISIGTLTKDCKAIDLSMRLVEKS